MSPGAEPRTLTAAGLLWLAAFSLLFTIGWAVGIWPNADSRFAGPDLPAGLAFGAALGWSLLRPVRRPKMSSGLPAAHGGAS